MATQGPAVPLSSSTLHCSHVAAGHQVQVLLREIHRVATQSSEQDAKDTRPPQKHSQRQCSHRQEASSLFGGQTES